MSLMNDLDKLLEDLNIWSQISSEGVWSNKKYKKKLKKLSERIDYYRENCLIGDSPSGFGDIDYFSNGYHFIGAREEAISAQYLSDWLLYYLAPTQYDKGHYRYHNY